jgi:hypothetical protein
MFWFFVMGEVWQKLSVPFIVVCSFAFHSCVGKFHVWFSQIQAVKLVVLIVIPLVK